MRAWPSSIAASGTFAVKPCSACATTYRTARVGFASSATSRQWTPRKVVSNRLHRVTQWMSNDVEALGVGDACDALLLTPKARLIAPLLVWRRGEADFLLLTEPELGEAVRVHLLRTRFRARCEIELEEHTSTVVLGEDA